MARLLPAPDSPTMPTTSPSETVRLTRSTARPTPIAEGNSTDRFSISRRAMSAISSVGLNEFGGARLHELDCRQQLWHQRPEVSKPIRFRLKHNDGNWEGTEILLKGQVSIHRDEHIEMVCGNREQLADRDGRQTHLTNGLHVVTDDLTRQTPVDAFVEKNLHEAASITRVFASSRKAMTCSRVTDGNPSRKSSIDSPASR